MMSVEEHKIKFEKKVNEEQEKKAKTAECLLKFIMKTLWKG